MSIDLSTWVPQLIMEQPDVPSGTVITSELWNNLWRLHQSQGDDTANTLKQLYDDLKASIWHETEGASYVSNPTRYEGDINITVADQLEEDYANHVALELRVTDTEADIADLLDGSLAAYTADRLNGELATYYATAAQITNLQGQINSLAVGEISAFSHNDISNRDAVDAHPQASITGLPAALTALSNAITAEATARGNAIDALAATDILYSGTDSVRDKLDSQDAAISALAGGELDMNHNSLLLRTAANAHPISAITGLQAALDAKENDINLTGSRALISNSSGNLAVSAVTSTELGYLDGVTSSIQTQLNGKQKTITASTANPSGGSNGDVWIKY